MGVFGRRAATESGEAEHQASGPGEQDEHQSSCIVRQNMCLDAHHHESTGRGGVGGQLARESTAGAGESTQLRPRAERAKKIGGYIKLICCAGGAERREENFRLGCAPEEHVSRRL